MKVVTLEDLQELGRILGGAKSWRPMTEQEIGNFGVIPEGAKLYPDYESYKAACKELSDKNTHHQTFCARDEGLFWTVEL